MEDKKITPGIQLQNISTESLVFELKNRQGVTFSEVTEDETFACHSDSEVRPRVLGVGNGPATVLIVGGAPLARRNPVACSFIPRRTPQ